METLARNKFIYIIGITIIVLIVLMMIVSSFQQQEKTTSSLPPSPFPTVTPFEPNVTITGFIPGNTQTYRESVKKIDQKEATMVAQNGAVGRLLEFLPHTGTNITMRYDYNQNIFSVTIPQAERQAGEKELDAFLKQNGVQNRTWIDANKLVITYE